MLDIPKSYRESNIDQYVLKPIKQELTAIFKDLTIKKKYGKGQGKPVIGYQFTFKPEIKKADDFNKHAPTKEEQKRKLELLQQLEELEKQQKKEQEILSSEDKKSLLSDLDNLFN